MFNENFLMPMTAHNAQINEKEKLNCRSEINVNSLSNVRSVHINK